MSDWRSVQSLADERARLRVDFEKPRREVHDWISTNYEDQVRQINALVMLPEPVRAKLLADLAGKIQRSRAEVDAFLDGKLAQSEAILERLFGGVATH